MRALILICSSLLLMLAPAEYRKLFRKLSLSLQYGPGGPPLRRQKRLFPTGRCFTEVFRIRRERRRSSTLQAIASAMTSAAWPVLLPGSKTA